MRINVVCPHCQERYQLEESLRGRLIRCFNSTCRSVFEVREAPAAAAAPPQATTSSTGRKPAKLEMPQAPKPPAGGVGDMVPILDAEIVEDDVADAEVVEEVGDSMQETLNLPDRPSQAPTTGPAIADWRSMPPPDRQTAPAAPQADDNGEADWRTMPPPPKRGPGSEEETVTQPAYGQPTALDRSAHFEDDVAEAVVEEEDEYQSALDREMQARRRTADARRRRMRMLLVLLPVGLLVTLLGIGGYAWYVLAENEAGIAAEANDHYEKGELGLAARRFRDLLTKYPASADAGHYTFMADLSELRDEASSPSLDPTAGMNKVRAFLENQKGSTELEGHEAEVGTAVVTVLKSAVQRAREQGDQGKPLLNEAASLLALAGERLPDNVLAEGKKELDSAVVAARKVVNEGEDRKKFLDALEALTAKPSAATVKQAWQMVAREARDHPQWAEDPAVKTVLDRLYAGHMAQVKYTADPSPLEQKVPAEDREPSLLAAPLVGVPPPPGRPSNRVVFALVRGVLYALSQDNGEVRWATRVGVDTTSLPLRLPAEGARPEMVLVLSADTNTLTALEPVEGAQMWRYRLSAPCLGQPVVVDLRAYIATYDGQIHEIELAEGKLLGRYQLGEDARLRVGGTREEGTRKLYFPADDVCIYVLDVGRPDRKDKPCDTILYTDHPSGSLRGAPVIVERGVPGGGSDGSWPDGYLILGQAEGLNRYRLRAYGLPLRSSGDAPLSIQPEPIIRGWPWFPPQCDGEKLAMATDAGLLGLFGINQARNQDPPLFPLSPVENAVGSNRSPGRALVAHARDNQFWVLADGQLQKWLLTIDYREGPKLISMWNEPPHLGSPLHAAQVDESAGLAFLVTLSPGGDACLATAVNIEDGKIRWQRQLGVMCDRTPLVFKGKVLSTDSGGGLFQFDGSRYKEPLESQWLIGGQRIADPLPRDSETPIHLVGAGDGATAYQLVSTANGKRLVIRQFVAGASGQPSTGETRTIDLRAPLAGTPAVVGPYLMLPLADGSLFRLPLPVKGGGTIGPDWRASRSDRESTGHVVAVGPSSFLTTNGLRGITHWNWPGDMVWGTLPIGRDANRPTREMTARIVSPPVVVTKGGEGNKLQVCVADAAGNLTLLEGDSLTVARQWTMGGRITSGPFLRDGKIGCVVDDAKLVWVDPAKEMPLWTHETTGHLVGEPELIDGVLLLAEESGKFIGLDPATGKPTGKGYTLKANVAPATAPVAYSETRVLAPLTDGTMILLPKAYFRNP